MISVYLTRLRFKSKGKDNGKPKFESFQNLIIFMNCVADLPYLGGYFMGTDCFLSLQSFSGSSKWHLWRTMHNFKMPKGDSFATNKPKKCVIV